MNLQMAFVSLFIACEMPAITNAGVNATNQENDAKIDRLAGRLLRRCSECARTDFLEDDCVLLQRLYGHTCTQNSEETIEGSGELSNKTLTDTSLGQALQQLIHEEDYNEYENMEEDSNDTGALAGLVSFWCQSQTL